MANIDSQANSNRDVRKNEEVETDHVGDSIEGIVIKWKLRVYVQILHDILC